MLIFSVFTETISRILVTAAFELNQRYIVEFFCINKDRPMLHCDGQCYLAEKLRQAEEKEKNSEKESQKVSYQPAVLAERSMLTFPVGAEADDQPVELPFVLPERNIEIFRPPRS
ncbi:hypothetical protein ACFOET_16720 [Parapedobacter deserti]|uniref:Uncharacterized protein n=1 Tax=Parapedobacter deserti TaxID=1912957 RepID=A0ABV7JSM0_9SPHI